MSAVTAPELGIHFEEVGNGPPVLLLHAFPLDGRMWRGQVSDLSSDLRVLIPDMPGFGRGAAPTGMQTLDDWAAAIVAYCRGRSADRPVIAGCSMGGYLAFAIHRNDPSFARAFALVDTRVTADSETARRARYEMVERARVEGTGFLLESDPPVSAFTLEKRPDVVAFVKSMMADATSAGVMTAQRAMASRVDSADVLATIDVPIAVIHGIDDPVVALADGESMAKAAKDAVFVPIANAGHLSPVEDPTAVNAALRALLHRTD